MRRKSLVLRIVKLAGLILVVLLLGAQVVRPAKTNPDLEPARTIEAHADVPPRVADLFKRACNDCHSNRTVWPWYSNVAPVSWFVIDHVNHGRSHLNFSDWARYDPAQADELLGSIVKEVRAGSMPLTSYTLLHPEAKLSQEERDEIIEWARKQGSRARGQGSAERRSGVGGQGSGVGD